MYDLLFTGDTFLLSKGLGGGNPFSPSVTRLFNNSHHVCVNLETTVGEEGKKVAKAYNFQAPTDSLRFLSDNNVQICSLANNHSLDYGEEGLRNTISHLRTYNLSFIGTQECNRKDLLINGKRVRLSSYYGNQPGLARNDPQEIIKEIIQNKREVDVLFVCLHWGEEYVAYPSPWQQRMAHSLIDAGADVVIGHHPHVAQGYEEYKNGLIFYSLGNFNFYVDHPYAKRLVETTKAYCVGLNINNSGSISFQIIPIHINESWQPQVITEPKEVERINQYIGRISVPLVGNISQVFYLSEVAPHYFHNHLPSWKKRIKCYGKEHFLQMIRWMIHPSTYKYYLGLLLSLIPFYKKTRY